MSVVLIVEDEAEIAEVVADVLQQAGHTPHIVTSGLEALVRAQEMRPDVVLLDLMLPYRNGFEVADDLRSDVALKDVPIVVMSAMHRVADRAAEIGTPYAVGKPFNISELLEVLHRALTPPSPTTSAA